MDDFEILHSRRFARWYMRKLRDARNKWRDKAVKLNKKVEDLEWKANLLTRSLFIDPKGRVIDNLVTATELIKKFVKWGDYEGPDCPKFNDIKAEAESFLKELAND